MMTPLNVMIMQLMRYVMPSIPIKLMYISHTNIKKLLTNGEKINMTTTGNNFMKLTLSFIPNTIIAFRTITYHAAETEHTLPYKIWGDQAFWDCCGEYFIDKIKPKKQCMLFIQKNTLK